MSYTNFGRGRGFGPRGSRATASSFSRPRFPPPPFRHVGPPRPGRPFMPWQPNNMFFQPHLLRGNPQFRPGSRRKNFCGYNARLSAPNRLPVPLEYEDVSPDLSSLQIENNQTEATPQIPLPGSEEERQQKIMETADRLKQKLSCFSSSEMKNIWSYDKPFSSNVAEDDCTNNTIIATLRYQQVEHNLISNDLTDNEKINPDDSRLDNAQYISNDTNNDMVMLEENENESQLTTIPNDQMTNLSVENEYLEMDNWLHESDNLEQSDLHKDNNVESGLLDSDLQCEFNIPVNTSQDCCDQQQDISQGNEVYPISATIEQDVSKTSSLQNIPFPTDLTRQDILQKDASQSEQELVTTNLEVQENILESQVPTISSSSNNCTLSQSTVTNALVLNNITSDNQVPKIKKNSFHNGPPKLSPHTEQGELPVDFDPSTPPPILVKQDESRVMPPPPVSDVLPLFNPTEPPPNIRHLLTSTSKGKEIPMWNNINVKNSAPATYNREMHAELNTNGGFISQQLPLESQSNVFLPPHIDTIQFSSLFSVPPGSHSVNPNVPSHAIFPTHAMSHNSYASSSPSSELLPLSDCNTSKDDGLNDMQEALKFAKQMTNITEKREKESSSKSLCESSIISNSISNVEFISLPPGEPKAKINTKKTKRNDIHSKKISQEQRVSDHLPLEETVIQDTRSVDMLLVNEQERPKVVFNLNNKTKVVNTRAGWRENTEKKNGIMQFMELEKMPSISKKNVEGTLRRNEERRNLKKNENNSGNIASSDSIANQNTVSLKKIPKKVNVEKSHTNISLLSKTNMQKSMSYVEKNENFTPETSWKNKIISRFLKMSKNEIFNMVNNTTLRKFDVLMKRLVKERKASLSLEMRHAENEKMKLYDQQQFIKQLNAMLDTDATVSVTDLPTEFIHHLNEVLQLDVQQDNHVEPATTVTSNSQNSHMEDANHVLNPVTLFISECSNRPTPHINQECERNKSHMIKTGHDKDAQMHHISRSNDFNLKDDTFNTTVSNKSSINSKLSALQHDLDDIFSEVTKKNQIPAAMKERKYCNVSQRNTKKFDDDTITRSAENDTPLEDDRMRKSESCTRLIERCDRWKRKEREDPYAYRNLTKEEWEAKYGTQANSISSSSLTKKINTSYKNPSHRGRKKSYPRRRHSSESSKHVRTTRHRTLEKDKHKKSRRHSDDRRHSAGYTEYNNDRNDDNTSNCSNNSNSNSNSSTSNSTSSSSSSSCSSNDSNGNTEPNVTKLLRAIKEKEKVAKNMSLNETIRDEVNAEIERERKQKLRKSRKYKKWRKEKKLHHKRKKKKQEQSKKTTNSFDSFSDDNEEIAKLLTENEIKKEIVENEITQEVIVKEELDISQEENTRDAEFANPSSHVVVEDKTMCSLPESNDKREKLESALLTAQEPPLTTVNQPHAEDRPPTASPTQLKTKAQLKQMPEVADTSDNKVFLKIFTTLPEDWNTIKPTECSENLNKSYQATDVNRDETEVPAIDNFASSIKNCDHLRESSNENAIPQQSDVCTSSDSFINATKIKGNTNILTSANVPDKATTIVASTSAISSDLPINISRKSRRACKKIDIKTYYERTIQRRMNEQEESKKSAENLTTSTQDLSSTPKIVKPEIPINKSTSILTYDSSIQDPRLFSAARLDGICCQTNSKDNEIALRNDVQQEEKQIMKTSKIAKIALKPVEENLHRVTDTDSTVEKINQDTSKDKHPSIANTNVNVLSNVTTNTISSKSNTGNVMDKKLQNRGPSDSKKFKNIRSEGSKELKLKKEITKIRKTKKKSGITLKSINILSTKIYPLEKTTENASEVIQEKKIDNASDMNKIKIERTTNPCENKVNNNYNNNAEMKVSIIFSENTDNNNELSQSVDKTKESFSSLEFIEEENTGNDVGNIESTDSPETMQIEEANKVESANNAASIEVTNKEEQNTREMFNISKSDVSAASIKISNNIVKEVVSEDIPTSDEQFNATSDATEFSDQIQVEKSNNRDLSESTDNPVFGDTIEKGDMSSNPELDTTSRPDIDDTRKDQPLINTNVINDVEINDKENNAESIAMDSTCKSVSNEDNSLPERKTAEESASITGNGVISPESVGSPFKGFLPETMIDFEQPSLFNLELHEKDKLFLNDCNVNPATREEETKIVKQQNYESSECNCADNMSMNENFNVTFGDTLLASDKERATSDKSGLTEDENRQGHIVEKSSCEIVNPTLHEDDNIDTGEADEADKCLINESQLTIKESMFINEEEMIQDENGSKDLTSKLTTTIDPSLSDALDDAAISDDALRLAENQSAEHLNNHNMYLETNISTEKISCDKLPGFDSDEHLDNDMFYLDDHLQSAATFDNKDETSFSIHQETSPRYDIIPPTVTPEPTMITSCADLSHDELQEERHKFDLKHISSTDNSDLLARVPSVEHSPIVIDTPPRTLNIPTKAALKEAATNHFLKSPDNSTKETTQEVLEKTQQSETESYQTPTWHVDIYRSTKTHSLDTHTNNSVNVNTISSTQNNPRDERVHTNIDVDQSKTLRTSSNNEKCLHSSDIQHNPVVELRKMKELDRMMNEKKTQEKTRDDAYKDRRKRNGTILHKLKGKRQMKYRSERINPIRNSLTRKLKSMKHFTGTINSKEAILARMLEIDIEMHKLTTEKLKLHEMLQNNVENTVTNNEATRENDTISDQVRIVSTLTSQSPRDAKINRAKRKKHSSSSKQSPIKRKKTVSRNSEDDETTRYMQKKMPVIRWKKTPRLEHTIHRREEDLKEENDLDKTTEQTFANEEVDISSVLDASKNATIQKPESNTPEDATIRKPESNAFEDATIQKPQSNDTIDHDTQVQETAMEKHEKANCDIIDESVKHTFDRSSLDKSADNHAEDSTEREHSECFDIDKRNDISVPSKTANAQLASVQLRGTPESLSIYSDDSTWDFFVQNTASEMQENRNVTGLVLLDEKLKKEQARSRKLKAIVRKKKKEQLNNYLKRVNNLTMEEEELPLSKLYIRKLRQKRDLLDSLTQRKEDANIDVDPEVLKNVEEVINAVAENRVEDLYEPQTRNISDIPTTSNLLSQPEEHQLYVDAEAANSDWPCQKKKDIEETTEQQQDSNNAPTSDESNHVFKVVNQNKTPFYDEHNVEPDSSVTPEETLIASHSLDCERVPPKDNVVLRNFDIKVSVPKVLIKDDFSLGLLQKFKDTESGIVGTGLVDSTTNMLATNAEKSIEKYDKDTSLTAKSIQVVEEDKRKEESEMNLIEEKEKQAVDVSNRQNKACELQKDETINNVKDTRNAPQSNTTKSKYSDTPENEDTCDSVASNNKVTMTNVTRDSSVSDSIVEKVNERQKKSDNESEQLSCDAIALKQDYQDAKNANVKENERSDNPENGSRVFETILDNDQNTRSSISIDRASEKSTESTDTSVDQRSSLERTTTSVFSFDKITTKSMETNKARSRRKSSISTPVRRSARYINENVKSNKMNEVEMSSNSNSSEQSGAHERDPITQSRSRSPTTMHDEKILNNVKRNRAAPKTQTTANRKVSSIDCEIKIENQVKSHLSAEPASSKNKTTINAKKRKHTESQMMNCKVKLIDCKHTLLKQNVNPEILDRLGIIAINPYVSTDISYVQRATSNQDMVVIPATISEQNSYFLSEKSSDKKNTDIEILEEKSIKKNNDDEPAQETASTEVGELEEAMKMQYTVHKGPILDIKIFENSFLAASEDGKIYRYSQTSNGILNIYKGHKSAVTCLHIYRSEIAGANKEVMFSGSLDGTLRCYNIMTGALIKNPVQINSPIQCMDQAWGMIFIGTKSGHVSRFHIKASSIKGNSIGFSDKSVLALKATNEGARRILIVASRNQPITIRDAQTGLFLRTISGQKNHTVYSLMRHNNLIYCGTSSTSINVFDFTTGEQTIQYDAGVGIVCMRLSGQLLFAGCYDGNIYVFDTRNHKLICNIPGPGNMLLSIEVVNNKIIAGSKDKRLHSWQMPTQVRALL